MRIERWVSTVCAIPWLAISVIYTEALAARLVLSRWPRPMLDDPKWLGSWGFDCVGWLLLVSILWAIPMMIVFTLWNWRMVFDDKRYWVRIGAFVVGVLVLKSLQYYDPAHVWAWFLD